MSDTFLVGVDGSDGSQRAALFAVDRAKRMGAKLLIVYVIEWSPYSFNTPEENEQRSKRRESEINSAQTKVLDPLLRQIELDGVETDTLVRHGHIAEVMNRLADQHKVTGMYIGRLGNGRLKSIMFGSVTNQLVQSAHVPVTVVP